MTGQQGGHRFHRLTLPSLCPALFLALTAREWGLFFSRRFSGNPLPPTLLLALTASLLSPSTTLLTHGGWQAGARTPWSARWWRITWVRPRRPKSSVTVGRRFLTSGSLNLPASNQIPKPA